MSLVSAPRRPELLVALAGLLVSLLLIVTPPITIGGLALWLYLMPALVVAYCVPYRLLVVVVMAGIALAYLASNQYVPAFAAEAIASAFLLLALTSWRTVTARLDTVLIAVTLITFVAYPWITAVNYFFGDVNLQQALYIATRYSVSSLVSVILAELFIIAMTLAPSSRLQWFHEILKFRPSFVRVVELIIGASITVSLILMLSVFWNVWDRDVKQSIGDATDTRIQALFSMAELAVTREMRRIDFTLTLASPRLDTQQMTELLNDLASELARYTAGTSLATPSKLQLGAQTREGQLFVTEGLATNRIATLLDRARDQQQQGLVALVDVDEAGKVTPAYVLLDDARSDLVLQFPTLDAAHNFTYIEALARFDALYGDPISRVDGVGEEGGKPYDLPDTAVVLHQDTDGWVLWRPRSSISKATRMRAYSARSDASVNLTASPSAGVVNQFAGYLHGVSDFAVTLPYLPFVESYLRVVVITSAASLVLLVVLLWAARLMVGGLMRPLSELTRVFERWRELRGKDQNAALALKTLESNGFSLLEDIRNLQMGFQSLAHDVIHGERRLSTIAANYDELLRSLPLGVLAVDEDLSVQFSNDAMSEITERQQEAIDRIKAQAAQLLAAGTTVADWQLNLSNQSPKNLLLVVSQRLNDSGEEYGFWVIATDLTTQKQTNAQLIQASKLATLGEMSTGIAHELNQPLNVISLATNNLRFSINKGRATPESTLSKLDRIDGAVHRAASIIDHMRGYGRLAGENLTEINVGEIVAGSCKLLTEQLKLSNITLVNKVPSTGILVQGNAIQLEQVLINLVNNAKDAIIESGDSGSIVVSSQIHSDRVVLRVTDSGGGIPDHVLPHIFEPFFTTKPVGKGTGLGGSISYGIVREMHGDIWAENVDGGAQISVSLPLLKQASDGQANSGQSEDC